VRKSFLRVVAVAAANAMTISCLTSCEASPPIVPASTSKSGFEGTLYKGTTTVIRQPEPGEETYRVFSKAATGFVSLSTVREDAEGRANSFCGKQGKQMRSLTETTGDPPFILGNFPKIEIIFDCVERPPGQAEPGSEDPKYAKLRELKKLLDDGVITQGDYDSQKAKILSQP
jgi:hypothetical protein